jgi:thymidylate kinase
MAKLIVIEGPDRVGKATQADLLYYYLIQRAHTAKLVEVPVKSLLTYRIIYFMLSTSLAKKFPKIFQWMQWLNKQVFQWLSLRSLEKDYEYLIFDRWSLSSVIYGKSAGVPEDFVMNLYQRLRTPDYTIVLNGKPHLVGNGDSYEDDTQMQADVRKLYSEWALQNSDLCTLIDANKSVSDIFNEIIQVLLSKNIIEVNS